MQRVAVVEHLRDTEGHPTAEEIHRAVSAQHPSVSRATVYNALHALVEAGLVCELTVDREAAHYDLCTQPHAHFRCRQCRRLFDVDVSAPVHPGEEIEGHRVESVSTYLYGLCAQCRDAREEDRNA
jgi:Fe2+ or Zn2+ uptake regulation protein